MKKKRRIGFLSFWGWGRGQAYVTLAYAKMLIPEYDVYILKQGTNKTQSEFNIDVNVMEVPNYHVDPSVFKTWIKANKIDVVVFNEYNQWDNDGENLVQVAKDAGAKTLGYLVWEKWTKKEDYNDYDRLLAPTVSFERFFRKNKIRNFSYTPYSVDLEEFPKPEEHRDNSRPFTFFHPGGWGGVHNRKNTDVVIEAFSRLDKENVKLIITSQKKLEFKKELPKNVEIIDKNLSRKELVDLYYQADCVVLPSKWETVGLPILESLAAGVPVITSNAPPMNEFISEGLNGYVTPGDMKKYPDIGVYSIEIAPDVLVNKMINVMNMMLHTVLRRNSRYIVEELYDQKKNKKHLIKLIEKVLE